MSSLRPPEATAQKKGIVTRLDLADPKPTIRTILPPAVVVLWLLLLALQIWPIVQRSVQPPIYDTLGYYVKARNFWATIRAMQLTNPLDLPPVFRPPGTILMSYPFGFTSDFHGFYFRSVIIPILLLVAAVYCAGFVRRASHRWHWNLAVIAMLLSSSPMFFHFERSEILVSPLFWGLVDNFIASVAGIAAALCLRSVHSGSLRLWAGAVLVASFSMFVKPAGALVMALTGLMWFLGTLLWTKLEARENLARKRRKTLLWVGSITALLIFGISILLCFRSDYLSPASLSYGSAAIGVMRAELRLPLPLLFKLIRASFGYVLPMALAFAWIFGLLSMFRSTERVSSSGAKTPILTMLLTAPLTCAVGVWFWIVAAAGATQIRYFFPFAVMAVIFTVPGLLILLEDLPRWSLWSVRAIFLFPVANLVLLLTVPDPSIRWQSWSGVNLSSGTYREEIAMSQRLISEIRAKLKRSAFLYSFYWGPATAVFESIGQFEATAHPELPSFQIARPIDWRKPSVIRVNELVESDYILFSPTLDPLARQAILKRSSVQDFLQEDQLFAARFTEFGQNDGLAIVQENSSIRLMQPIERAKFESRLSHFVASYSWPAAFNESNPQHWWGAEEIENLCQQHQPVICNVKFGDLYRLNALGLSRENDELRLSIWWQHLKEDPSQEQGLHPWTMFIHIADGNGKPLSVENMRLPPDIPGHEGRPIALDVLTFPIPKGTTKIGIGIFNGKELLIANDGPRDWEDRRVLLSLPAAAH